MSQRKKIRRRRRWTDGDIGDIGGRRLDPMLMTKEVRRLYFAKKEGGG